MSNRWSTSNRIEPTEQQIEEHMKPHTCTNCEHSAKGMCYGGDGIEGHNYGHVIADQADTCAAWHPEFRAWVKASIDLENASETRISRLFPGDAQGEDVLAADYRRGGLTKKNPALKDQCQ